METETGTTTPSQSVITLKKYFILYTTEKYFGWLVVFYGISTLAG